MRYRTRYADIRDPVFHWSKYSDNGAPALMVMKDSEVYHIATVNIDGIPDGHVAIKDYSENEGCLDALVGFGIVSKPIGYLSSGYVEIPICKITDPNYKKSVTDEA